MNRFLRAHCCLDKRASDFRILTIILLILLETQVPAAQEAPTGYIFISAGETIREINNAESPITGIYHLGLKGVLPSEYWEIGLLFEAGIFNRYPAFASLGEIQAHLTLAQESIRLGVGSGVDFQSYYRGNYRGQFDTTRKYTYRTVPMLIGQIQVFKKIFLEYQKNLDTEIFWKIRVGYKLFG